MLYTSVIVKFILFATMGACCGKKKVNDDEGIELIEMDNADKGLPQHEPSELPTKRVKGTAGKKVYVTQPLSPKQTKIIEASKKYSTILSQISKDIAECHNELRKLTISVDYCESLISSIKEEIRLLITNMLTYCSDTKYTLADIRTHSLQKTNFDSNKIKELFKSVKNNAAVLKEGVTRLEEIITTFEVCDSREHLKYVQNSLQGLSHMHGLSNVVIPSQHAESLEEDIDRRASTTYPDNDNID